MTANLTTVNIKKEYQKELKKLSQSWGMSQVEFINNAIWYFKKTGINPKSTIFSPKEEISKLEARLNQVLKFIRQQEKEKLNPLLDELIITERRLKESLALGIDKSDLDKIEVKIGEAINTITDANIIQIENSSKVMQKLSFLKSETNNKIDQLSAKNKLVVELISILFEALKNRNLAGKFNQDDINNFEDAIHKV